MPHVFISYARHDKATVTRLSTDLEFRGLNVWIDQDDIPPGQPWPQAIHAAIVDCAYLVLMLSPAAVESEYVRREYLVALEHNKPIIPVLIEPCEIPAEVASIQYIDLRADYQVGLTRLLAIFPPDLFDQALSVQQLADSLNSQHPQIKITVLYAVKHKKLFELTDPVIQALSDESAEVRAAAAYALQAIKPPAAIPALVNALTDDSHDVRSNAGWALVYLGAQILPELEKGLRQWGDHAAAREMALQVLQRIDGDEAQRLLREYQ